MALREFAGELDAVPSGVREFTGEMDPPKASAVKEFSGELDSASWSDVLASLPTQAKEAARLSTGGIVRALTERSPPEALLPQIPPRRVGELETPTGVTPQTIIDPDMSRALAVVRRAHARQGMDAALDQEPVIGPVRRFGKSATAKARLNLEEATPDNLSFWQDATVSAARSLGVSVPTLAAGIVTRSPTVALAGLGAAEFGASYDEARRAGLDEGKAKAYAGINATIEAVTEKIPLNTLLKRGTPFAKRLLTLYGQELVGENVATVLQDANEFAMRNPNATFNDWVEGYLAKRPEQAAKTSATTLIATTVQGGGAQLADIGLSKLESRGAQPEAKEFTGELDTEDTAEPRISPQELERLGVPPEVAQDAYETPGTPYVDVRLKREDFRNALVKTVTDDLVEGGGVAVVPDPNFVRGENTTQAPMIRTPSVNPEWAQNMLAETGLTVREVRRAAEKAARGESLGVRQAQAVQHVLNYITGERTDPRNIDYVRQQLQDARAIRKRLRGELVSMEELDALAAEADQAGELFEEQEYAPELDGLQRVILETAEQARDIGDPTEIERILSRQIPDAEVLRDLITYSESVKAKATQRGETSAAQDVQEQRSQEAQTKTTPEVTSSPEFRNWFGESKVRDQLGTPRVVYHGTSKAGFEEFDTYGSRYGLMGVGSYFTEDASIASEYTDKGKGENKAVYPVYLSIKNPIDMEAPADVAAWKRAFGENFDDSGLPPNPTNEQVYREIEDALIEQAMPAYEGAEIMQDGLRAMGYDGITHVGGGRRKGAETRHRVWIAFDPTQIKSAVGNRGTFDANNPNILYANPFGLVFDSYQRLAQGALDFAYKKVGYRFTALRDLPAQDTFLEGYYRLLGRLSAIDKVTRKLYDTFATASAADQTAAYAFLTSKHGDPNQIKDNRVRQRAIAAKRLIERVGHSLVRHKLLSPEAMEAHRGEYLPRVYLKYLLKDSTVKALSRGLKPGDQGYLKARKDIPADVRELILGELKDPGYLSSRAVGIPMRDMAILDFFESILGNQNWVLPQSVVKYNGANVSVFWLKEESRRLTDQAKYMKPLARDKVLAITKQMDALANPAIEKLGKAPENFKQIPDTKRYGALRGVYVRSEIYNQIIGARETIPDDASIAQKILGFGGWGSKVTAAWKVSKVSLNPPAQIRNATSNLVLLHLSGVPLTRIPLRLAQAIRSVRTNGKHWRIANKYGVTETTFAGQEFLKIEREMLDTLARHDERFSLADLRNLAGQLVRIAGDSYQMIEAVNKTAKIIDAMEREGKSEQEAALAAQEALFDYSLVPQSVRYLRSAPIGVPFLTFYYKVLPLLIRTAVVTPWRYLPYVAIPYFLQQLIADDYEVTKEDLDKLKIALPKWLQERGHTMFLPWKDENGRWQVFDYGYFMPWSMFTELINEVTATFGGDTKKAGELLGTTGLLGGPIPDLIAAIKTNEDPFTRRDIANVSDPPADQLASWMQYLWRLGAPTWLTDIGAGGHIYRSLTGHVNPRLGPQYGDPMSTTGQALARIFGMNVYPVNPELTVVENIRQMGFEMEQVRQRMRQRLRDPNLSDEQRETIRQDFMHEIELRAEQLRSYREAAEFNPKLLQ